VWKSSGRRAGTDFRRAPAPELRIENEIVGEALVALRHEELKEMGVTSVGHRLTILKGIYDTKVKQDISFEADHYVPLCTCHNLEAPSIILTDRSGGSEHEQSKSDARRYLAAYTLAQDS
jgi:SAM domain (Sterile alpha motif)